MLDLILPGLVASSSHRVYCLRHLIVSDSLAGFREMSAPVPTDSAFHRNTPQQLLGRAPARNDVGTFWRRIIATAGVCAEMNNLGTQEGENHRLLDLDSSIQPQMLLEGVCTTK